MNNALNLIGRLLLVALFLPAGLSKLSGFDGTVGYIESVGLPLPAVAAAAALALEILGSIALLVGFQTRIVAAVLAIFTLVASIFFHAFCKSKSLTFVPNTTPGPSLLVLRQKGPQKSGPASGLADQWRYKRRHRWSTFYSLLKGCQKRSSP